MEKFSKVFGAIVNIVTTLIIIIALCFVVPKLLGYEPYVVMSGSMSPTLETGSIVFINTHDKVPELGEIAMYHITTEKADLLVTHRVAMEQDGMYIFKGDNNEKFDFYPISPDLIIGTYLFHIEKIGYIYNAIEQKNAMLLIAVWVIILNGLSIYFDKSANLNKKEKLSIISVKEVKESE